MPCRQSSYRWYIEIGSLYGSDIAVFDGTKEDMDEYTDELEDVGYEIWGVRRMEELR